MKLSVAWKWFDLWVGAYWDAGHRTLYVCPLPTVVFRLEFRGPKDESKHRADRTKVCELGQACPYLAELLDAQGKALILKAVNARLRGALGTAIELLDRYSAAVHCLSIDREPEVEEQVSRLRELWHGETVEQERLAARAEQAARTMPLIGGLLDLWDQLPRDLQSDPELKAIAAQVEHIAAEMEGKYLRPVADGEKSEIHKAIDKARGGPTPPKEYQGFA